VDILAAGAKVLQQGIEVAAPVVKQGVDAATPFVQSAVRATADTAVPALKAAAPVVTVGFWSWRTAQPAATATARCAGDARGAGLRAACRVAGAALERAPAP
jgi:hypothetical protein